MNRRSFLWGMAGVSWWPQLPPLRALRAPTAGFPTLGFRFSDVTLPAGLQFQHNSGAFGGKFLPETLGSGCAFLDYDRDGWQDILLINGRDWPGHKKHRTTLRLYHNNGNGTFTDVTEKAGLLQPGIRYASGCTFIERNRNGLLDLFVANYLDVDLVHGPKPSMQIPNCNYEGLPVNCGPMGMPPLKQYLFRNNGDGTFTDVTAKAGLSGATHSGRKMWSIAAGWFDYNRDGLLDLFVVNYVDWDPRYEPACMGLNGRGYCHPDSFPPLTNTLYRNNGDGTFTDVSAETGISKVEGRGMGVAFADYDNDGWPDIFVANDHIEDAIERVQKRVSYAEPSHLFRNLGGGKFQEVTAQMGPVFAAPRVARGAAYADIDNDGFLDVLVTTNAGPAFLFHNEGGTNHSLRLKLVGTKSNRDGIGAVVHVTSGNNQDKQWKMLRSGSSYLSQSELVLTFGLGAQTKADSVEIQWPSGQVENLSNVNAGQTVTVQEGNGIVSARAYGPPSKSSR